MRLFPSLGELIAFCALLGIVFAVIFNVAWHVLRHISIAWVW